MKILIILNTTTTSTPGSPFSTHLRIAASENNITDLGHLLHCRHNIHLARHDLSLALIDASRAGHDQIATLLLENGADVNYTGGDEGSALFAASRNGFSEVMRLLLEKGARVEEVHAYGLILREILDEFWWDGVRFRRA